MERTSVILRPWSSLISLSTISLPISLSSLSHRLSTNLTHFVLNYLNISLSLLFLSLIFHPFSIILFLLTFSAWYYFLTNRDSPLTVFDRTLDDRAIFAALSVVTVLVLVLANVWWNVLVSGGVSVVVVFLLAGVREPVEGGEETTPYGSLLAEEGGYTQV